MGEHMGRPYDGSLELSTINGEGCVQIVGTSLPLAPHLWMDVPPAEAPAFAGMTITAVAMRPL